MNLRQKAAAVVMGLITLVGTSAVLAPAASAASCSDVSNKNRSQICVSWDEHGYNAELFLGDDDDEGVWDFNLICANGTWYGDNGSFYGYAYSSYSYVFSVGSQGSCFVRAWNYTNNTQLYSPSISR